MSSKNITRAEPIELYNLSKWIWKTVIQDRKTYKSKQRSMTAHRFCNVFTSNLKHPIFIVGSPRSGTTFLGSCIAELPEISYHFEPVATKAAARYVYEEQWRKEKAQWFYRTVYTWLMRIHFDTDLRFAEKTPRNCFLVNFLAETFPDAKFIHIIRDGRDAALSHSKQPWLQSTSTHSDRREAGGYLYGPYPRFWVEKERRQEFEKTSDLHRCIWAWRRHTESAIEQTSSLSPNQCLEVRYEKLVTRPREEANRILDFLEINASVSRQLFLSAVAIANPNSVGRWKQELSPEQRSQIMEEAKYLLYQLKYIKD